MIDILDKDGELLAKVYDEETAEAFARFAQSEFGITGLTISINEGDTDNA